MKERIVIHSDLNNFYASVEKRLNPKHGRHRLAGSEKMPRFSSRSAPFLVIYGVFAQGKGDLRAVYGLN